MSNRFIITGICVLGCIWGIFTAIDAVEYHRPWPILIMGIIMGMYSCFLGILTFFEKHFINFSSWLNEDD